MSRAQLLHMVQDQPVASVRLGRRECIVGRDASATFTIDDPRISRHHVRIRAVAGGHAVSDLRSLNGTELNGAPLQGEVQLASGDQLDLGHAIVLRYEAAVHRPLELRQILLAGALAVALLVAALTAWRFRPTDPVLAQATLYAREASQAWQRGEVGLAKHRLQDAAGLLFREGRLDGGASGEVMRVALERLGEQVGGVDLVAVFRSAIEARAETDLEGCRLDTTSAAELDPCVRRATASVLAALDQDPDALPASFYRAVHEELVALAGQRRSLRDAIERGREQVPLLRRELEQARLSPLLHYLAWIESAYQSDVASPAGARGLWQLMPATARRYGLALHAGVDERTDAEKSTRAAVRHLAYLRFELGGDSLLAVTAYNVGENGVRPLLRQLASPFADRAYARLLERDLLPAPSRAYVSRFLATAVLGEWGLPPDAALAAPAPPPAP